MIFYRLTDGQAGRATTAIAVGLPFIALMVLKLADGGREKMAIGFAVTMTIAFSLMLVQIMQSQRLNRTERDGAHG